MSFEITDMALTLSHICNDLQSEFESIWPYHPGTEEKPLLPMTQAQRERMLSYQDAHRSVRLELCCVLEGNMTLQVENDFVALQKGQLFLIPSGVLHNELSDGRSFTAAWFVFFRDGIHINISGFSPDGIFQIYHGQRVNLDPVVVNLILSDLTKELDISRSGAMTLIKCSILQLLVLLQRQLEKSEKRQTPEQWRESIVRDVVAHLQQNPGVIPDLSQLADRYAMSPNHLSSIFKAVTGKTINAYCGELRIQQAQELLRATPMKLRQIAETLGYYDQYHFCKAFKKATGMSPSAYRAEEDAK